jgi:hypothetical protein
MSTRYERLAASGDPLLREIGTQLGSGQVRPAGLLAVPEYGQAIRRGVTLLAEASTGRRRPRLTSADGRVRTAS